MKRSGLKNHNNKNTAEEGNREKKKEECSNIDSLVYEGEGGVVKPWTRQAKGKRVIWFMIGGRGQGKNQGRKTEKG